MRKRVSLLFWQHLWLVPDEEAGTLKLRKISRHYRILGSVMSPVFLVSWCFKNTHHMSFSPDVMHIFCQSPTSLLTIIFLLHSLGSLFLRDTSALLWSQQNRKFDISVPEEISPPFWKWRLLFTVVQLPVPGVSLIKQFDPRFIWLECKLEWITVSLGPEMWATKRQQLLAQTTFTKAWFWIK